MTDRYQRVRQALMVVAVAALSSGAGAGSGVSGPLPAPDEINPCAAKTLNPCAAKTLNPCAAKTLNPCAAKTLNPCAAKTLNPCAAKTLNPCAAKTLNPCAHEAHNPCAAGNPCGAMNPCNPCGGGSVEASRFKQPQGVALASAARAELVEHGRKLWNDRTLGNTGLACSNCHVDQYMQMNPSFAKPYPHYVEMPHAQAGVSEVNAAEMVQFCMIVPMADDPLPWSSRDLAALAAYVESIQAGYRPVGNPCASQNPCGARNPCNPCSGERM